MPFLVAPLDIELALVSMTASKYDPSMALVTLLYELLGVIMEVLGVPGTLKVVGVLGPK